MCLLRLSLWCVAWCGGLNPMLEGGGVGCGGTGPPRVGVLEGGCPPPLGGEGPMIVPWVFGCASALLPWSPRPSLLHTHTPGPPAPRRAAARWLSCAIGLVPPPARPTRPLTPYPHAYFPCTASLLPPPPRRAATRWLSRAIGARSASTCRARGALRSRPSSCQTSSRPRVSVRPYSRLLGGCPFVHVQ